MNRFYFCPLLMKLTSQPRGSPRVSMNFGKSAFLIKEVPLGSNLAHASLNWSVVSALNFLLFFWSVSSKP